MSKTRDNISIIEQYKFENGDSALDMHVVADWALRKGLIEQPKPVDPIDQIAKNLSRSAREVTRRDPTGYSYRAYHAYAEGDKGNQRTLWVDIENAGRRQMHKSLIARREQMVGDAVQLSFDALRWNTCNANEAPIEVPMNFEEDVAERRALNELPIAS